MIKLKDPRRIATAAVMLSTLLVVKITSADSESLMKESSLQPEDVTKVELPTSLFMSQEEQQAAEIRRNQNKLEGSLLTEEEAESVVDNEKDDIKPIQKTEQKLDVKADTAVDKLNRYDGVVLRDGVVLGLWVNAKRFPVSEGLNYMKLESVRSNGQAKFISTQRSSKAKVTALLYPGDTIPFDAISLDVKPIDSEVDALQTDLPNLSAVR